MGGCGFYLDAFLYGPPKGPPSSSIVRERLQKEIKKRGIAHLYEKLKKIDPSYAKTIGENDQHKIIRALEIIILSKKKVSFFPVEKKLKNDFLDCRCWFLYMPRKKLYDKVEKRCDEMIESGFIEEVKNLKKEGLEENHSASRAIGYKQCLDFLRGGQKQKEFISKFKIASRRYVKRQFTWFLKNPFFQWIDFEKIEFERVQELIIDDFRSIF